jgi:uncharacterized protein (DUF433 family)
VPVKSKSMSKSVKRRGKVSSGQALKNKGQAPKNKVKKQKVDGLNRREVASFSHIPLAAVDKAIEQKVLPRRRFKKETLIEPEGVALLTILNEAQLELPVKAKHRVRKWVIDSRPHQKTGLQELELSSVIAVRCPPAARERVRDARKYLRLRDKFIEVNPDIRGGLPVIAGTRIGVHAIADRIGAGDTLDMLVEEYPGLAREAFEVALRYAEAHPRRGRPPRPWA